MQILPNSFSFKDKREEVNEREIVPDGYLNQRKVNFNNAKEGEREKEREGKREW